MIIGIGDIQYEPLYLERGQPFGFDDNQGTFEKSNYWLFAKPTSNVGSTTIRFKTPLGGRVLFNFRFAYNLGGRTVTVTAHGVSTVMATHTGVASTAIWRQLDTFLATHVTKNEWVSISIPLANDVNGRFALIEVEATEIPYHLAGVYALPSLSQQLIKQANSGYAYVNYATTFPVGPVDSTIYDSGATPVSRIRYGFKNTPGLVRQMTCSIYTDGSSEYVIGWWFIKDVYKSFLDYYANSYGTFTAPDGSTPRLYECAWSNPEMNVKYIPMRYGTNILLTHEDPGWISLCVAAIGICYY